MTIKLYGSGQSRSFRCLWALSEAQIDCDFIGLNLGSSGANGAKSPEYLAINSQGKTPSLVHDGFVLNESAAILNYIDALAEQSFIPSEPKARAKYDELTYFILAELEQPLWSNSKHRFAIPEEHRIPAMLETAKWEFQKALKALAKSVTIDEYVLGSEFTFADILLAHTFHWAQRSKFDVPTEYLDYRDRLYARSAVTAAKAKLD